MTQKTAKYEKVFMRHQGLQGGRSLLAAVVARAVDDALGYGEPGEVSDARCYFVDGRYETHLELLDLPETWIPEVFEDRNGH